MNWLDKEGDVAQALTAIDSQGRSGLYWATVLDKPDIVKLIMVHQNVTSTASAATAGSKDVPPVGNSAHPREIRPLFKRLEWLQEDVSQAFLAAVGKGNVEMVGIQLMSQEAAVATATDYPTADGEPNFSWPWRNPISQHWTAF